MRLQEKIYVKNTLVVAQAATYNIIMSKCEDFR